MNLNETLELTKATLKDYKMIVLVEGISDKLAITTLAQGLNLDLDAKHIAIVAMGGAMNFRYFLDLLAPYRQEVHIAGLYDVGEERQFRRALEQNGFGSDLTQSDLERLGYYVCDKDLEDELIRALGVDTIIEVVTLEGDIGAFRTFQRQPEWRGRSGEAQLRRWMGAGSTRKTRYAKLLVDALNINNIPTPLDGLLAHMAHI